jgi:hypothetical protein
MTPILTVFGNSEYITNALLAMLLTPQTLMITNMNQMILRQSIMQIKTIIIVCRKKIIP